MTAVADPPASPETALAPTNGNQPNPMTAGTRLALPPARDEGEFANLLDASRFSHMQRVAKLFAASQLVPQCFQNNEANCFIALQMAVRLGVDPFMLMQNTYIVHGKPGMEAKLAIALINSSGLFTDSLDFEIQGTDPRAKDYRVRAFATRKATKRTIHGPWIDWELVKAEGWYDKSGSKWKTMPGLMFQYRAATYFGRLHCPERLMGMQTVDELRDTPKSDLIDVQVIDSEDAPQQTRTEALKQELRQRTNDATASSQQRGTPDAPPSSAPPAGPAEDAQPPAPEESQLPPEEAAPDENPDLAILAEVAKGEDHFKKLLLQKARDVKSGIAKSVVEGGIFRFFQANKKTPVNWLILYRAIVASAFDFEEGAVVVT